MSDIDPIKAADYILKHSKEYAQAKANRVWIEEYRKSLKALLMGRSPSTTGVAKEMDAYSDDEYIKLLDGLKTAVEIEETYKWNLEAAKLKIEIWKANLYANKQQDRALQ